VEQTFIPICKGKKTFVMPEGHLSSSSSSSSPLQQLQAQVETQVLAWTMMG